MLGALLVCAGCVVHGDAFQGYTLIVLNRSSSDRLIVLGREDGSSTQPAVLVPHDGTAHSTSTVNLGIDSGTSAVVKIYDLLCVPVATVVVRSGIYELSLDDSGAKLSPWPDAATIPPAAAYSTAACPGAAPS